MMMIVKISRLMETPAHEDSWVDIAGYAAITAEAIADSLSNPPLLADQQSNAVQFVGDVRLRVIN